MSEPAATIKRLYDGLAAGDGDAMAACYAPDASFEDPAFGYLEGERVGGMWRMLTSRGSGVRVELEDHAANATTGTAHWIARYEFEGRPVVNDVRSTFRFTEDGLIAEQLDKFDLQKWGAQAMGTVPGLLGHTPLLGMLVRRKARGRLDAFLAG